MGKKKNYSDETSKLCQKLWEAADSPGGGGMRLLKDNVSLLNFRASNGKWYHKTNVGRGSDWSCGAEGTCQEVGEPDGPDVSFYYKPELNYPFCFAHCETEAQLVQAFAAEGHKGNIWVELHKPLTVLAAKNYPIAGQILGVMKVCIVPKHRTVNEKNKWTWVG